MASAINTPVPLPSTPGATMPLPTLDQITPFLPPMADPSSVPRGIPNFNSTSMFGNTHLLKWAAAVFLVFSTLAVTLRLFCRRRFDMRFWWDDVCVATAGVLLLTNQCLFSSIEFAGRTSFAFVPLVGGGGMLEEARIGRIVGGLKMTLAFEVLYLASIYLVKFSMLFLYDRFAKHTRHITMYLRITQTICFLSLLACLLSLFLSCQPISNFWNPFNTTASCTRRTLLAYVSGISNIITNTLVLAVPVPLLLRARLSRNQIIGVSTLYFFGLFVIAASALRFVTQLLDVSVPQAIGWSQIEISLAILLACAPMSAKLVLQPLEQHERLKECYMSTDELIRRLKLEKRAKMGMLNAEGGAPGKRASMKERYARFAGLSGRGGLRSPSSEGPLKSPDLQRLRVVRNEVNGQSVWEVRPATSEGFYS